MKQVYRRSKHVNSSTEIRAADGWHYRHGFMPVILITLLFLAGCASLSKDECAIADWYAIGIEDGSNGQDMSRLGAHRKACAKVGVTPDTDRYTEGRLVGLQSFCTYQRGYSAGKWGRSSQTVCPAGPLEAEFIRGYNAGLPLYCTYQRGYDEGLRGKDGEAICQPFPEFTEGYGAGRHAHEINQQIRGLQSQLADVRTEIADIRQKLETGVVVDEAGQPHRIGYYERRAMLDHLLVLDREEGRLLGEIDALKQTL